jgi:uncharacterized delta-60 repeat protein
MKNSSKLAAALALGFCATVLSIYSSEAASLVLDQDFRSPLFAKPLPAQRTLLLPDGKFLLFHNTDTLTDQRTGAITRYLPNGSLDSSFNVSRDYKRVAAAASVANGKLVIAATQYLYGNPTEQILRLNSDGSIDASFNAALVGSDPYFFILAIVEQPDGKILVSGYFDTFAGLARQKIVRLLADGTLDSTFTPPDFGGSSYAIYSRPVVLASGKILVAGDFRTVNGAANLGVAQLNADGSPDPSFQASGFTRYTLNTAIRGLAVQSDGKILLAGRFRIGSAGTGPRPALLRLNADGSLDPGYLFVNYNGSATGRNVILQPDGKAVAALSNSSYYSVYRFEATGPLDGSFAPPALLDNTYDPYGATGLPTTLNLQPDGRIILGGIFTDVNPPAMPDGSHFGVVRLNSDGSVDPTLVTNHRTGLQNFPTSFARIPDGSALVAFGNQSLNDPAMNYNLGRLAPNGSLDSNFTLSSADPASVLFIGLGLIAQDFAQLADGSFFVFGFNGGGKFLPNGVQDPTFLPQALAMQKAVAFPDGKVLLCAGTDPQSTIFAPLARLRGNGSFDNGFGAQPSIGAGQVIRDQFSGQLFQMYLGNHVLAVQPDGKILFLYFWSDEHYHFVRLNTNGTVDPSFAGATIAPIDLILDYPVVYDPLTNTTVQPPGGVWSATAPLQDAQILPDGGILLCGPFTSYNGVSARGVVRLQPDGSIDPTFSTGGGAQWTQTVETPSYFPFVESIEEQVDGKLLIAGTFEAFNGTALPGIASLNSNGSVDTSFIPPVKRQRFAHGTARLARQSDGSFLLSGPYSFPNETEPGLIHINSIGGVPVVGSPALGSAIVGLPFTYQIAASGQPTSYSALGLPAGFSIDPQTGLITGTPNNTNVGIYCITVTATNGEGTSAIFNLTLTVTPSQTGPPPSLQNIATRLRVLTGDNVLIGGFIITGYTPKRVLIRAVGPSLTNLGISGALADSVLELHGPSPFATITNDNWRDAQQSEIQATGLAPSNDLESAIVATLPAGAYTAIVRGTNDGTGIALVEAYDLDSTADTQLANISTRGFVDAGDNVMIGGLIAGPTGAGSGRVLVRAIGPSLTSLGIPNALQNPMLELHDASGTLIASNRDWKDTQQPAIEVTGIAPIDEHEAAIIWILSPGNYTAIVRGENNATGVGLVEVYNLQ